MADQKATSEEIDLIHILQGIKNAFFSFLNFALSCVLLIKNRWYLFVIMSAVGAGAGYGLYTNLRPVFVSSITLSSKILTNEYCADIIHNLQEIVEDQSPDLLAKNLGISANEAGAIKKIEFSNFDEKLNQMYEDKDTIVLGIPFKIIVHSYDNKIFTNLEPALVKILENNDYAQKRKKIRKDNLTMLRQKMHEEMVQLDSLKKNVSNNLQPRGTSPSGFVFGQPIDPINIYKAGIEMFRTDLNYREELELIDGIQVVDGFSMRDKPDSPKLLKTSAACIIAALFLTFIVAFQMERRKKNG